jgi:hypothetical protein
LARVLIVYRRAPKGIWRSTYGSHLGCFERYSDHEVFYLNTAREKVPDYIRNLDPDLVIYHYTAVAERLIPEEFEKHVRTFEFTKDLDCAKALVPHDEQAYSDTLAALVRDFRMTHVFTPASPSEWAQIYTGVDLDKVAFRTVLTGYVDDEMVARVAEKAAKHHGRPIDIGYRSSFAWPFYGRHGQLKGAIGDVFAERAPEFGLSTDISSSPRDAILGDAWFDFLLDCKYTIGVEGGSSVLDHDGAVADCTWDYLEEHPSASFEEVEAVCFPGRDGEFHYRLVGPRHFEAVMTRTCQVLMEGEYSGVFTPGEHYIELKEDFSNLDDVLRTLKSDDLRKGITDRAYRDIIESGAWTYRAFADYVFAETLGGLDPSTLHAPTPESRRLRRYHRYDHDLRLRVAVAAGRVGKAVDDTFPRLRSGLQQAWAHVRAFFAKPLSAQVRDAAVRVLGEERLWRMIMGLRNAVRRVRRQEPLALHYVPTEAEAARRAKRAEKQRKDILGK